MDVAQGGLKLVGASEEKAGGGVEADDAFYFIFHCCGCPNTRTAVFTLRSVRRQPCLRRR